MFSINLIPLPITADSSLQGIDLLQGIFPSLCTLLMHCFKLTRVVFARVSAKNSFSDEGADKSGSFAGQRMVKIPAQSSRLDGPRLLVRSVHAGTYTKKS
ncbi:hypothetical protein Mp_6g09740 [Marchantia polymorpha subsp. ruderalis]|uniref:Uncharacterized protein n=2 Tax=Marchantia polymorpha TaxID=3197 RepID=A0AAF6BQB9_MARPO|nr:hypothetical protein MARPO_0016s0018 [Marchantia polymorpha]BBN14203.1 hypothetical protein Mp_6g09740 [Marchantia polymorpha subsp. ruderalis]|eukprot:PTQ44937.1 hypothetical protein MARPO_0016s0018 [Marchantia polymorpha]